MLMTKVEEDRLTHLCEDAEPIKHALREAINSLTEKAKVLRQAADAGGTPFATVSGLRLIADGYDEDIKDFQKLMRRIDGRPSEDDED